MGQKLFEKFDANNDGKLGRDELINSFKTLMQENKDNYEAREGLKTYKDW